VIARASGPPSLLVIGILCRELLIWPTTTATVKSFPPPFLLLLGLCAYSSRLLPNRRRSILVTCRRSYIRGRVALAYRNGRTAEPDKSGDQPPPSASQQADNLVAPSPWELLRLLVGVLAKQCMGEPGQWCRVRASMNAMSLGSERYRKPTLPARWVRTPSARVRCMALTRLRPRQHLVTQQLL
jgi:hypothetical protein